MIFQTVVGENMNAELVVNYLRSLVNYFFKILPIKENGESSLEVYMKSLQIELIGCKELIVLINNDAQFLSLINILQYLIDHPECEVSVVKREVFKSINICNKLVEKYGGLEDGAK